MSKINELTFRRRAEVSDLAEFIAIEYAVNGKIDPNHIASENDIPVIYNRYGLHFDGMLVFSADRFFIYCNLDKSGLKDSPRARFTVAHELGHYFLDEHRRVLRSGINLHHGSFCEYDSKSLVEQEADLFASHLLMPKSLFEAQIRRKKPKTGIEEILHLKEVFGTSITSTAIRFVEAEILPGAIFFWDNDGNLKWCRKSTTLVKGYIGNPIGSVGQLRDSATNQAFKSSEGITSKGATLSTFFQSVTHGSRSNAIVREEAIRLGGHGVLTFIMAEGGTLDYGILTA